MRYPSKTIQTETIPQRPAMPSPALVRIELVTTPMALAAALDIRRRVFVEEQGVSLTTELDGLDGEAHHVLAWVHDRPAGTSRLHYIGPTTGRIGRVAVLPAHRGLGLGGRMVTALEAHAAAMGVTHIVLHPHAYLEHFYARLGYRTVSGSEVIDGYLVLRMEKTLTPTGPDRSGPRQARG